MDKESKQYLEWINENLMAAVLNQEYLYLCIQNIGEQIKELKNKSNT